MPITTIGQNLDTTLVRFYHGRISAGDALGDLSVALDSVADGVDPNALELRELGECGKRLVDLIAQRFYALEENAQEIKKQLGYFFQPSKGEAGDAEQA